MTTIKLSKDRYSEVKSPGQMSPKANHFYVELNETRVDQVDSYQFSRAYWIPTEFDLSGRFQGRYQQCLPVGNKTDVNCIILLLNNTSHSNFELIPTKKYW